MDGLVFFRRLVGCGKECEEVSGCGFEFGDEVLGAATEVGVSGHGGDADEEASGGCDEGL